MADEKKKVTANENTSEAAKSEKKEKKDKKPSKFFIRWHRDVEFPDSIKEQMKEAISRQ